MRTRHLCWILTGPCFAVWPGKRKEYKRTAVVHCKDKICTEISKQIFPEKKYWGLSPNFHILAPVTDLYIPTISLPSLLEEICRPILGLAHRHMNVEIGAEATLFPE